MMAIILWYKPYLSNIVMYIDLLNEFSVLCFSYMLIPFAFDTVDIGLRYNIGWFIVAVTCLNILLNCLNLVGYLLKTIVDLLKRKI